MTTFTSDQLPVGAVVSILSTDLGFDGAAASDLRAALKTISNNVGIIEPAFQSGKGAGEVNLTQ